MCQKLPREIDPFRLAHASRELNGKVDLLEMTRLAESLRHTEGVVKVWMRFDVDDTGMPFMQGHFETTLSLTCERCLQEMTLPLEINTLLGIIRHEKLVEKLSDQYEPWVIEDAELTDPVSIVEDELILALPLVPKHDENCLGDDVWFSGDDETEEKEVKPTSPFSVLASLKTNK